MAQYFSIHPLSPQPRLIRRSAEIIREGGVVVYPTDTAYALGCGLESREGLEQIRRIRQLGEQHNFTLICKDLSHISTFAKINNEAFRFIKSLTPGPFTFILKATRKPRAGCNTRRKNP